MKPFIRVFHNRSEWTVKRPKNTQRSKTVPDQAMTIKEIVTRFNNGLPVGGGKVPEYFGEEMFPNLAKLDLSELHALRKKTESDIREIQDRLKKDREKRYWQTMEEQYRKKFEDERKEQPEKEAKPGLPANNPSGTL